MHARTILHVLLLDLFRLLVVGGHLGKWERQTRGFVSMCMLVCMLLIPRTAHVRLWRFLHCILYTACHYCVQYDACTTKCSNHGIQHTELERLPLS